MRRLLCTRPKVSRSWLVTGSLASGASASGVHPLGAAVGPVLFLPDRHDFLEAVDGVAARLERFGPVRTADGDRHAHLSDLQMTEPMDQGHLADGPAVARLAL